MRIDCSVGTKVRYAFEQNGYNGDQIYAKKYLKVGETYTVDYTVIHSSTTDVYFKEIPGHGFNSVLFEEVDV
jgi:hypothetical protein